MEGEGELRKAQASQCFPTPGSAPRTARLSPKRHLALQMGGDVMLSGGEIGEEK